MRFSGLRQALGPHSPVWSVLTESSFPVGNTHLASRGDQRLSLLTLGKVGKSAWSIKWEVPPNFATYMKLRYTLSHEKLFVKHHKTKDRNVEWT